LRNVSINIFEQSVEYEPSTFDFRCFIAAIKHIRQEMTKRMIRGDDVSRNRIRETCFFPLFIKEGRVRCQRKRKLFSC